MFSLKFLPSVKNQGQKQPNKGLNILKKAPIEDIPLLFRSLHVKRTKSTFLDLLLVEH